MGWRLSARCLRCRYVVVGGRERFSIDTDRTKRMSMRVPIYAFADDGLRRQRIQVSGDRKLRSLKVLKMSQKRLWDRKRQKKRLKRSENLEKRSALWVGN